MNSFARKLFVMGHARSGTTIMGRLLNSAESVFLLGEAQIYETYWSPQFVTEFNARHLQTKTIKSKGVHLPAQFEGMLPEEILKHYSKYYNWVGEKVAIGPTSGLGAQAASRAIDYYSAHHLDASYVLTFRAPIPSLESLRKLFPNVSLSFLLQGWMLSYIEIGAATDMLSRVVIAPLELMSFSYWERIQRKFGIVGRADENWMRSDAAEPTAPDVVARLAEILAEELGWDHGQAHALLDRLSEIYAMFLDEIDPETLYYKRSVHFAQRIATDLLREVHEMLSQLSPNGITSRGLPISVCGWSNGGTVHADRRVLPLPYEQSQRFTTILRDSLFSGAGSMLLTDEASSYPLAIGGIDLVREGAWLLLHALPNFALHRHLTVAVPIEPLTIATVRLRLRVEPRHSRFVMLQVGNASGFYNTLFDCEKNEAASIFTFGAAKHVLSQINVLVDHDIIISLSGMVTDGPDGYVRLYMCDDSGSLLFDTAQKMVACTDGVLSYDYQYCGLG